MKRLRCRAESLKAGAALAALVLGALACKPAWKHDRDESASEKAQERVVPQRVDSGSSSSPLSYEIDARNGRVKGALVLRLDYFPEVRAGGTNLPACMEALSADFEIGTVRCEVGGAAPKTLFAKNVDQDCYTDGKVGRIAASEPATLADCNRGIILVHRFAPVLRVDLEAIEVN